MKAVSRTVNLALLLLAMNCYPLALSLSPFAVTGLIFTALLAFGAANLFPLWPKEPFTRLNVMASGYDLCLFYLVTMCCNAMGYLIAWYLGLLAAWPLHVKIIQAVVLFFLELFVLLNACIRMLCTSVQLGIKWRVLLLGFWWLPVVNFILLLHSMRLVRREYCFETNKQEQNLSRAETALCKTRYPILLVHGVFFRDVPVFNYWGRIPKELMRNGAAVFYGKQQSAAPVYGSGAELAGRIRAILAETGCEKVNIIAHSKGGLDARSAITQHGMAPYVASLTTINTPHRGCLFADYLLQKVPEKARNAMAKGYNSALKRLGDTNPDFLAAVNDLTAQNCAAFQTACPDSPQVFYQSVGSKLQRARGGKFPLNLSYHFVRHFDGPNDGLVSSQSAVWGSNYRFITTNAKRGVSHADMVDLNRENIPDFDVREFYIKLVAELKKQGF